MVDNIEFPLFRARKLKGKNPIYVEGYYYYNKNKDLHIIKYTMQPREGFKYGREMSVIIDVSTLAIHFSDMLDSEKNKIFASLNKSGRGGDILEYLYSKDMGQYDESPILCNAVVKYTDKSVLMSLLNDYQYSNIKIKGIKE